MLTKLLKRPDVAIALLLLWLLVLYIIWRGGRPS